MRESGSPLFLKKTIGVLCYRTVFPLYSEVFITKQMASLKRFEPTILCRDLISTSLPGGVFQVQRGVSRLLWMALGSARWLRPDITKFGVSLVHAHFFPDGLLALPIARELKIPLIVTCHGSDVTRTRWALLTSGRFADLRSAIFRKKLVREAARFIAVSDFLRGVMIKSGIPPEKVVRHYIGVDTVFFQPAKRGADEPYVVCIARHERVKGVDVLIQAMREVKIRVGKIKLLQVGTGSQTSELQALARDLQLEDDVLFLGSQGPNAIRSLLQGARCVVLPSRRCKDGAEEALGLAALEAAACGVPVVGTRTGGIPEVIRDGKTGCIVEPDDPLAMAESIVKLLADPALSAEFGRNGRLMVCDSFNLQTQTAELETIYLEVLRPDPSHSVPGEKT